MPLVANSALPSFERLRREGETVLNPDRARQQDIREMHIGLLNMMPDAALEATERQFLRLVGESNQIAQFHMHLFSLPQLPRGEKARTHIEHYYESFDALQAAGLDALIITGVNITHPSLSAEPFWKPLIEIIDWAYHNVTSTLCSCLTTHAVMQFRHGQQRQRQPDKCWGVFPHEVIDRHHPLVNGVNTLFDVPHSRFNEITREQFEAAGLPILVESPVAGVHLAVSEDLFRIVYFQGHPEYDINSLLKEYKREINRFIGSDRTDYPAFPDNYFDIQSQAILREHREQIEAALAQAAPIPNFPESLITERLHNTWHDTGEAIISNWVGQVYQLTNSDRKKCFMDGIDPDDPLSIRTHYASSNRQAIR